MSECVSCAESEICLECLKATCGRCRQYHESHSSVFYEKFKFETILKNLIKNNKLYILYTTLDELTQKLAALKENYLKCFNWLATMQDIANNSRVTSSQLAQIRK